MYILDFLKNLFKKNNVGIIIWLILNLAIVMTVFAAFFEGSYDIWVGLLIGFLVYAVSIALALSPVGEWVLRMQNGCHKIDKDPAAQRLMPIFNDVYARAKQMNPELPDNIKMFISNSEDPNAFATGRKTVCVTRGLLQYSDEHIKGVLSHEFGHLAHKDTDVILVVAVGNLIVNIFFIIARVFVNIMAFIAGLFVDADNVFASIMGGLFSFIARILADIAIVALMRLWTQIGVWLCMHSSRKNEYRADEYACKCGYGAELAEVLQSFGTQKSATGLFASLAASHPENIDRINKIKEFLANKNALSY